MKYISIGLGIIAKIGAILLGIMLALISPMIKLVKYAARLW